MAPANLGPYVVIQEIARGGQGVVYLARHPQLRSNVAIKVLLDPTPNDVLRFKQEARVLAQIRHPNLLQVIDYGQANGYPYMVMEYINGWDLRHYLQNNQVSLSQTIELIKIIAQALAHLHQYGLTHRDLKPGNILIEKTTLRPVLADLGLAKRGPAELANKLSLGSIDARLSMTGEIMGTPTFMAPEQVSPEYGEIGPWTDVYGLAATLFQLLTGQTVFTGVNALNILVKIQNEPPPHPKDINPSIPSYIDEAIWLGLQKDPKERPPSIEAWIAMLQPPKPKLKRKLPKKRRKWLPAAVGALGFSSLVAYFLSLGATPKEAKNLAKQELQQATISSSTPGHTGHKDGSSKKESTKREIEERLGRALKLGYAGNFNDAIVIVDSVISDYPDFANAYLARGTLSRQLGTLYEVRNHQLSEARAFYQKALDDVERFLTLATPADVIDANNISLAITMQEDLAKKLTTLRRYLRHYRRYSN